MKELSFFLALESQNIETAASIFLDCANEKNITLRLYCSDERNLLVLPEGYDGYLIHLSQVEDRAIEKIKSSQPWSKIYGTSGASRLPDELIQIVDRIYYVFTFNDIDTMLEETKKRKERYEE